MSEAVSGRRGIATDEMRRHNLSAVLARVQAWRAACPDLTIRSTFITGFPGETEEEFEHLLEFIAEAELDRVGCFAYSPVEGATANELPGALPDEVRHERQARFMQVQQQISERRLRRWVGRETEVLVDAIEHDRQAGLWRAVARSQGDAPEIDGLVQVQDGREAGLVPGEFVDVRIMGSDEHDLYGEVDYNGG